MSYIRALSNPERLYIFGNRRKQIEIYANSDNEGQRMPESVFRGLLMKWLDERQAVSFRGAHLIETIDFKWNLQYKSWKKPIKLWQVTLFYIASNVEKRKLKTKATRR